MDRNDFINKLYTESTNSTNRRAKTTPKQDGLEIPITGLDIGSDRYDNYYIKTFWGTIKAYYFHIELDVYLTINQYIHDNNIVESEKAGKNPFEDTVDVEAPTADKRSDSDSISDETVDVDYNPFMDAEDSSLNDILESSDTPVDYSGISA